MYNWSEVEKPIAAQMIDDLLMRLCPGKKPVLAFQIDNIKGHTVAIGNPDESTMQWGYTIYDWRYGEEMGEIIMKSGNIFTFEEAKSEAIAMYEALITENVT